MKFFISCLVFCVLSLHAFGQRYEPDSAMVFTDQGCKLIDYYFGDSLTYTWSGKCESGWLNGKGELTKFDQGEKISVTSANYLNGVAQGEGSYTIINTNERYYGRFIDGQMTGDGEYWNDGGDHYIGQLMNFMIHGKGKMIYANGSVFEGTFNKFNIWTGKYINLKDEIILVHKGEKVDKLPPVYVYSPKIGEDLTEYFDSEWKRCNKQEAAYFRKIRYSAPHTPEGKIRDFYIDGNIQNEYYVSYLDYVDDEMNFFRKSRTKYYYPNGNVSSVSFYDHQSRKNGIEYEYYESGELFSECYYGDTGLLDGPYMEFYKNGNLKGYCKYSHGAKVNNAYWQISEDGYWMGINRFDFEKDLNLFELEGNCANPSDYSGMLYIDIQDKNCNYYNPSISQYNHDEPFSLQLDVVMDKPHKDKTIGLIFNYVDENNFTALKLNGSGLYSIISFNKGKESNLVQWTSLDQSKEKDIMNFDVLLSFIANELILEINDVELNRIPFQRQSEMEYGLFFSGKGLSVVRTFGEVTYFDEETSKGYMNFALAERQGESTESSEGEYTGNGSGFLITNDGYIATNYHVIEDVSEIKVVFDVEGEQFGYQAEIIQSDKDNDVAILKIDLAERIIRLPYKLAAKIQEVGASVFALGYPYSDVMGSEIKYTNGSINARTGLAGDVRYYQVSAPVQPGNSGGPCFNEKGEVVGIVSAGLDDEVVDNQNVNYVLKISYLKNLMELLPEKSLEFVPVSTNYKSNEEMIKAYKNFVPIIYTK